MRKYSEQVLGKSLRFRGADKDREEGHPMEEVIE